MKKVFILILAMAAFLFYGAHFSSAQTEMPMKDDAAMGKTDVHSGMHQDMMMQHHGKPMGACGMSAGCACGCGMSGCSMRGSCGMGCGMMGRGMMGRGMRGMRDMMGGGMRGMMGGMAGHRHMKQLLMQLDLSDAQRAEISGIHDKVAKDMIRRRADMQIAKLELGELLQREPVDLAAVDAKVRQIQNMKTDMFITFLKTKEQIKAVLSPEQRKRLKDLETGSMAEMEDGVALSDEGDAENEADED